MTQALDATLLSVTDLRCWFETPHGMVFAVQDVSLSVSAGQRVGIVGESGSGKTQTFFGVFGLSHGTPGVVGGRARFADTELLEGLGEYVEIDAAADGAPPRVTKQVQRWSKVHNERLAPHLGTDVAVMFQDPKRSLVPYWSIGRHLSHVITRRDPGAQSVDVAKQLLASLGFRDPGRVIEAFPEQLSGGEAQRAMLALTMAMRPRLLIADEPTTGLDTINQARVLEELQRIHAASDLAIVLISHDLAVIERLVDYTYVFFAGRVLEHGPASVLRECSDEQIHPYTRQLRESQRRRALGLPIVAAEAPPSTAASPRGCPYAARCDLRPRLSETLRARCDREFPEQHEVEPGHFASCWGMSW